MTKKIFDTCRFLEWFVPAASAFYAVVDMSLGLGYAEIVTAIAAGFAGFMGVILQHESKTYFADKEIVPKDVEE